MSVWAVIYSYRYEAVEFVKETDKTVVFIDRRYGSTRETRCDKRKMLDWRGTEDDARKLVSQLTSAVSERERRVFAAKDWFRKRVAELTASGEPS